MSAGRAIQLLGSWWLTALLLLVPAAAYLALSIGRNPYPAWVQMLLSSAGGIAVLLGLAINLTAASIRIALTRLRRESPTPEYIRSLDAFAELPLTDAAKVRAVAVLLRIPVPADSLPEAGIRHTTGRWSFLPGAVFRIGAALTLISLLVSVQTRRSSDIILREGERSAIDGTSVTLTSVTANLPADHLQVGEDGSFLLKGVSARLDVNGSGAVITPGFPTRIRGAWYRIRHLGYSQEMIVTVQGKQHRVFADLDLLPPGRLNAVPLPGAASLSFTLDPDRTIEKGLLKGRQYNLAQPAYRVLYHDGKSRDDGRGSRVNPGGTAAVGPAAVSLGRQGISVRIQAVSDPVLPCLYAGVVMLLAGFFSMFSRFFWYERDVALLHADGRLLVGSRDEFFRKWGVQSFRDKMEKAMAALPDTGLSRKK